MPLSTDDWIKHFVDHHTVGNNPPSPDDIRKYPGVLLKMIQDHYNLHVHFYTGHEHDYTKGLIVPGRLK